MGWDWQVFGWCLVIVMAVALAKGWRPRLRDLKLWGEDVTPEQRRNNLMGLAVILALVGLGLLFRLTN